MPATTKRTRKKKQTTPTAVTSAKSPAMIVVIIHSSKLGTVTRNKEKGKEKFLKIYLFIFIIYNILLKKGKVKVTEYAQLMLALVLYLTSITALVIWSSREVKSSTDFIIGNRSLNYWLTAMAAHASDMSSWMFMAYPALIYATGLFSCWVSIGLIFFMWLNWLLVAPKFRILTGRWNCSTFSSFLHARYKDESGILQLSSALFCFIFYTVYIGAGLTGLGLLGNVLFDVSYSTGILVGGLIVVAYVVLGGFISLAWIDFVQGIFLLAAIIIVPYVAIDHMGGWQVTMEQWISKGVNLQILPKNGWELFSVLTMSLGWGLGYFGQPHIITKFMGIKDPKEISKSRNVGMTWMTIALAAATLVGLVGINFFTSALKDPQMVFINMVKELFPPFIVGLILCAILAATINVMSSQLLILSSILTEDVYKKFMKKKQHAPGHLLYVSRLCVLVSALLAYGIAAGKLSSIYHLVHYAWSGLGASFGSLVLVALYSDKANKYGAICAIIVGGLTAAFWPYINTFLPIAIDSLIPGFIFSFISIFVVSYLTRNLSSCDTLSERIVDLGKAR